MSLQDNQIRHFGELWYSNGYRQRLRLKSWNKFSYIDYKVSIIVPLGQTSSENGKYCTKNLYWDCQALINHKAGYLLFL